jgi:hypothetical protein
MYIASQLTSSIVYKVYIYIVIYLIIYLKKIGGIIIYNTVRKYRVMPWWQQAGQYEPFFSWQYFGKKQN